MPTNFALASEGATLTGTNAYGSGAGTVYDITWANNGGSPLYDGSAHFYAVDTPDNIVITFSGSKTITSVVVWFSDFDTRTTDPGDGDDAVNGFNGVDFTVDTWNGASWDTQATVTGNTKLKRTFTFTAVATTKVRLNVTVDGGAGGWALQELEAWGAGDAAVGNAAGSSTAVAENASVRDAAITGVASAVGVSTYAVGSAAGVATAPAIGQKVGQGTGSVTCYSFARARPPYFEIVVPPSLLTVGLYSRDDGNINVLGQKYLDLLQMDQVAGISYAEWLLGKDDNRAQYAHNWSLWFDGICWGGGTDPQSAAHDGGINSAWSFSRWSSPLCLRVVFPVPMYITGLRIYAGRLKDFNSEPPANTTSWDACHTVLMVAPPEEAVAPSPMFVTESLLYPFEGAPPGTYYDMQVLNTAGGATSPLSGTLYGSPSVSGFGFGGVGYDGYNGAGWYDSAPNDGVKVWHIGSFVDSHLYAKERKVGYVDLSLGAYTFTEILEIQFFTPSVPIFVEVVETAEATDSHILYHVVTATPDVANATSTVFEYDAGEYVSTAHITNPLSGSKLHIEAWTDTANAVSVLDFARVVTAVSTANATSLLPVVPLTLALVSTANATSVATSLFTALNICTSTANATSAVDSLNAYIETLVSSAAASERTVGVWHAILVSNGAAQATALALSLTTLRSSALASSVVSPKLVAYQTLLSSANAASYIILADSGRYALWTNSATTALGSWSGAPFETMIEMDGEMYAAGDDGVYQLSDAVSDDGTDISAELRWDLLSYNSVQRHRPGEVYLGGQAAGSLNIRVSNEQGVFNYATQLSGNTKDTNLRARIGKGVSSRFIRITLTNPNGVHFSINEAQVEVIELARQVGGKHG